MAQKSLKFKVESLKFIMTSLKYFVFLSLLFLHTFIQTTYASSEYVLPYPSFMPGNILYKPKEFVDSIKRYIYFGDFAQFKYQLAQSDKYLVEAKTLVEYKQYLFASEAISESNRHFQGARKSLGLAEIHGKTSKEKMKILKNASLKHIEVLKQVSSSFPDTVNWENRKERRTTTIDGKEIIANSILLRKSCL